ncbi:UvrD-helicase domain-containing protein [Amycolatopsis sp. GM8]|uniref:UvrD-helicase domain-containing protein n=1 Tax=Amycolatopsis sp. GM8 TaxID=2896530 RepID=UPI001F032BD9|nr:UvrD-helicase domain-containing protein [Amycolatopsis sp. GM8]
MPRVRFVADLHIHSKYSRACSKDCDLEHLTWWARRKGITLVGTGDFTHPAWFEHLRENLVPAEPGLFRLREDLDAEIQRRLPPSCAASEVRFMLSVEISTIYKRAEHTRKVHHLIYMPDFEAAERFNQRLGKIGNLGSDGRPILGLDSRDLLEITLESGAGSYLVPAHVWTPWFAVLGSKSGFDAIDDCYADLAEHVFALETGLSSDPEMNWKISALDKYRLVSNSDAHSPPMLGREATVFDTDLDYFAVKRALETGRGHAGSLEFFPEEGKYHVDGHRKCGVRMEPGETRERGGLCPECGKPVTVGVLSRVEDLADRAEAIRPAGAPEFTSLVQLPEIMGEILSVGPKSKKVLGEIDKLTAAFGPELVILQDVPVADLESRSPLLGEAVRRLRRGDVIRDAGYDGEYGVIRLFEPAELKRSTTIGLFDDGLFAPAPEPAKPARKPVAAPAPVVEPVVPQPKPSTGSLLDGLDPEQREAAGSGGGPLLIIAGPGTGKTRTLTHRIAHLVSERDVAPEQCLAITFTRRAAEEMAERLAALVPAHAAKLTIATFHSLGVRILREQHDRAGLSADFGIADQARQLEILAEVSEDADRRALAEISRNRRTGTPDDLAERYTKALRQQDLVDFDDLVALPVALLEAEPELAAAYRERYRWISVDEYQDVDEQQYRLLRLLAPGDGNLTAIGDPDQAIYRFRGADVGFFLRFQEDFAPARTVQLTRNYRSNPHVLGTALRAIAPGTLVPGRELRPCGEHGDARVGLHHAAGDRAEAAFVARTIDQLLGGASFHSLDSGRVVSDGTQGLGFSDFAVLYRTDRQARALLDAFAQAGLPVQKRSHDRLLERSGVEEIVAELAHPGAGTTVAERVRRAADAVLARGADEAVVHTAAELLKPLALRCDDLEQFRTELSLGVEVDTWDPRADRVSLLTLHASKGLEFPVVFVVGCEEGLLPLRWPGAEPAEEELAEERRLLFVGITRAQRHLYLSHAAERSGRKVARSRFLADLGDGVEQIGDAVPRARPRETQLRLL